jgi:DNA-binding phage protein
MVVCERYIGTFVLKTTAEFKIPELRTGNRARGLQKAAATTQLDRVHLNELFQQIASPDFFVQASDSL